MAWNPREAALALHRFGFGPRTGSIDAIADDPRGALLRPALAERLGAQRLELAHVQYYGWALANRAALMPTREEVLHSAMRFSLSHLLSEDEAEEAARRIAEVVHRLRGLEIESNST